MTFLLAAEALFVLVLLCQLSSDISLQLCLHELASSFVVDVPALRPFAFCCTEVHGRHTACSLSCSGDAHLLSDLGDCSRERSSGAAMCRPACASSQPALDLVVDVDAWYMLEPQALFVELLKGRGVAGELEGQQLLPQTSCRRLRSVVKLLDMPSPCLPAFIIYSIANDVKHYSRGGHHEQKVHGRAVVSLRSDVLKPMFMTGVSDAAEFVMAFIRFLSNCPR